MEHALFFLSGLWRSMWAFKHLGFLLEKVQLSMVQLWRVSYCSDSLLEMLAVVGMSGSGCDGSASKKCGQCVCEWR